MIHTHILFIILFYISSFYIYSEDTIARKEIVQNENNALPVDNVTQDTKVIAADSDSSDERENAETFVETAETKLDSIESTDTIMHSDVNVDTVTVKNSNTFFLSHKKELETYNTIIGMQLQETHDYFGIPYEVFVHRGNTPATDNVVFFYDTYRYIFWFNNRVWQLFYDHRYTDVIFDIAMGASRQKIISKWGEPFVQGENNVVYNLPEKHFPMRIRLIFVNDMLYNVFIYRSDY